MGRKEEVIGTLKIKSKLEILEGAFIEGNGSVPSQDGHSGKYLKTDGERATWASPTGSGDMLESVYDPENISGNAFSVDNHVDGKNNKVFTAEYAEKLDGISELATPNMITSFFGRTGDIIAKDKDYTWEQIDKSESSLDDIKNKDHSQLENSGAISHKDIDISIEKARHHLSSKENPHDVSIEDVSILETKGDIFVSETDRVGFLPIGKNGQVLSVNSATASNLEWATTGDMRKDIYDPEGVEANVYDSDFFKDGHQKKVFTANERSKLAGIQERATANTNIDSIYVTMRGKGDNPIQAGDQLMFRVPYSFTIKDYQIFADQKGSIKIDIRKSIFDKFPALTSDSITNNNEISIKSGVKGRDSILNGWFTGVKADEILIFTVESSSLTMNKIDLSMKIIKK